ncbi:ABC transporter substrate-binding protein [Paludibacterium paludis]|uniref:Heme-binding protein n=1 Tax=Paludibacterium paludis TaxID=1225769 RepID=A0A918P4B3_9NEIS|nr:ABC transporter substrate-binding protein [Paludibacterium paludis]GGY20910.1 heme-binding protein [Paludibacterium paludis]
MSMKRHVAVALLAIGVGSTLHAADMNKVLHDSFIAPETGFDPAKVSDVYSSSVNENLFDPLLTYDYLARPAKLIPNTVTAMPDISADGKTVTMRIKPGIYFAPDPAFKGKKRELTAADYVYSFKRVADPLVGSPSSYLVRGKFVGLDELVAKAKGGRLDYDTPIEGLKALDRYTLQMKLVEPTPGLKYMLAMPHLSAVAREVIEAYGTNTNAHPVGTGPYMLAQWKPGTHISLVANPNFRKVVFNYTDNTTPVAHRVASEMNGKLMPQIGRIEISVIQEEQPRWLAFRSGQLDLVTVPQPAVRRALILDPKNPWRVALKPELKNKGVQFSRYLESEVTFYPFNMKHPVIGGLSKERIALRRAIAMSFNTRETISDIRRNQAVQVQSLIPANVAGHNPGMRVRHPYDPALANALLDRVGYRIGADGYRTQPDGKPLVIDFVTGPTAIDKQWNEYWQKAFDLIKIRVNFRVMQWNEQQKVIRECSYGMAGGAWLADYPDGDNFVMLLYGKNVGDSNYACYQSPRYDKLYEASQRLPDGPERDKLFDQMDLVASGETPWVYGDTRFKNYLSQRWVRGFVPHPVFNVAWRFIDIQK